MGVTLHYKTVQPVPEGVRQQILEEIKRLEEERNWWTEPIHFSEAASQQHLLDGFSKVPPNNYETLDGKEVTIQSNDWAFMAYWDFRFIISNLCRWSVLCLTASR